MIRTNENNYTLVFMIVMSLGFCLFAQRLHASETNENETGECGEALIAVSVPAVLEPVGTSSNTEMIEISTIDTPNVMKGVFSFPTNHQQRKEIEIEYRIDGHVDMYFLSRVGLQFLKKEVLDEIPANLLSKVNRITILITTSTEFRRVIPAILNSQLGSTMFGTTLKTVSHKEEKERVLKETLHLEEVHYNPVANEITFVIPYDGDFSDGILNSHQFSSNALMVFIAFKYLLVERMRHKLGHIMAYHRYGKITPDQEWQNAILKDNKSVSQYGDTNIIEDFAETMELYIRTDAGLNHPEITRRYVHRFKILDEIVGLESSERRKITENNRLLEERISEINVSLNLLEQLGINEVRVRKDEDEDEDTLRIDDIREIREVLPRYPNGTRLLRKLANKALTLQRNGQLNFTSIDTSSVRERLIRRLVQHSYILFTPEGDNIPQFITETIDLLDTLSTSEVEHRLYVLDEAYKRWIEWIEEDPIAASEGLYAFERAVREVQNRTE